MKLSKTSALAALAMTFLARQNNSTVTQARQVAEHLDIPLDSALKILQCLARHRLIDSQLGRGGGYRLTKTPDQVNLLQIVEAIDGPLDVGVSLYGPTDQLAASTNMLDTICHQVALRVRDQLAAVTVASLAGEPVVPQLQEIH